MATLSVGPLLAGTGTDDSSRGSQAWTNPGNITAEDGNNSTVGLAPPVPTSHWLMATNFGFTFPANVTILGIKVEVKCYGDGVGPMDARMVKGGVISGSTLTDTLPTGSLTWFTFGSETELWGLSWTPADITPTNFGFVFGVFRITLNNAFVDAIRITVYYRSRRSQGYVIAP